PAQLALALEAVGEVDRGAERRVELVAAAELDARLGVAALPGEVAAALERRAGLGRVGRVGGCDPRHGQHRGDRQASHRGEDRPPSVTRQAVYAPAMRSMWLLALAATGCRSILGIGDPPPRPDAGFDACATWQPAGFDPCALVLATDALSLGA